MQYISKGAARLELKEGRPGVAAPEIAGIVLDPRTQARIAELAERFRREGSSAPHEAAISQLVLELQSAVWPELLCDALREEYRAEIDAETVAEAVKSAAEEARESRARAWHPPPIPLDAIECLVETYRPRSMRALLFELRLDDALAEALEIGPGRAAAGTRADPAFDNGDFLRWAIGYSIAAEECLDLPDTEAARAWCVAVGEEVERRIAAGWTPTIPTTSAELAVDIPEAAENGEGAFLARRLVRFGCSSDEERVARLVRAYRMRLDAERAELAMAEAMLEAIEAGDLAKVRALDERVRRTAPFTTGILWDVDYFRMAVDPEIAPALDPEPLGNVAEQLLSWTHKDESENYGARDLEARLLAALSGRRPESLWPLAKA